MRQLTYRMTFSTPAFLGNAERAAQWRTPPLKALLRQWWRVVYAAQHRSASVSAMRSVEGRLFGHAWLESDADATGHAVAARRSPVRLRLSAWRLGTLQASRWSGLQAVQHPEVSQPVAADLYLGFGPVVLPKGQRVPTLKSSAAIQAGEAAMLTIAVPDHEVQRIERALGLIANYGTVGGRSRNGWGSLALEPVGETPGFPETLEESLTLAWRDAICADWPQAIGRDERGPLIWHTEPQPDWQRVIRRLAEIKIALRTRFRFPHERPDGEVHDRHWLSYPITNHKVQAWDRAGLRLPNSLRFKVRPDPDGKLRGVIFHMPCLPPPAFRPDRAAIERVWQQVHAHLDDDRKLQRIRA
ncbi:MAG: hypothetical protein HXY24_07485 [Rubrivivax sp.]|nr:hypothetical protein [Rubrivivax sp.]